MKKYDTEGLIADLKKSKDYIDKLVEGINPVNGKPISTREVIYDYKVSRQLEFLSEYIKNEIKRLENNEKAKKEDEDDELMEFELTDTELKKIELSEKPISLADICNMLNHLRPSSKMRKLKSISAIEVLNAFGMIDRVRRKIIPTEQGTALGIQFKEFQSNGATLTKVLYSKEAQQFVIDHLKEITEINKTKAVRLYRLFFLIHNVRVCLAEKHRCGEIIRPTVKFPVTIFQDEHVALHPRRMTALSSQSKGYVVTEGLVGIATHESPFGESLTHARHQSVGVGLQGDVHCEKAVDVAFVIDKKILRGYAHIDFGVFFLDGKKTDIKLYAVVEPRKESPAHLNTRRQCHLRIELSKTLHRHYQQCADCQYNTDSFYHLKCFRYFLADFATRKP